MTGEASSQYFPIPDASYFTSPDVAVLATGSTSAMPNTCWTPAPQWPWYSIRMWPLVLGFCARPVGQEAFVPAQVMLDEGGNIGSGGASGSLLGFGISLIGVGGDPGA